MERLIEKVKNVYKIKCLEDNYCLKVINYEFEHFYFILDITIYLFPLFSPFDSFIVLLIA